MRFRHLGRTGLRVSEICLGTMTFGNQSDRHAAHRICDIAVEAGVNFFDSADVYQTGLSEEILGGWLKSQPRDRFVIATKVAGRMGRGWNERGLSRGHILSAVDASLRRLQTDYIDLYQLHAPDPTTPLEETLRALDDLVRWGKVRYIGCSNYPAWEVALALGLSERSGWARLDSHQPRYNVLFREIEHELLPLCRDQGIGVIAYNPLAGGFLTGKYRDPGEDPEGTRFSASNTTSTLYRQRYWNEAMFATVARLQRYFEGRGVSLTHAAVAWVLAQPGITSAIVGASRPDQIADSLKGIDVKLTDDDLAACDDAWYDLPRSREAHYAMGPAMGAR
jgi:aryl-alcohol dehydrogenase-like predicted oxidoreductase